MPISYAVPKPAQIEALDAVTRYSFALPPDGSAHFRGRVGHHELRVLGRDRDVYATLGRVPMGLWLGNASVSNLGVAAVAVAPERRGQGLAKRLMIELVREARHDGFAISTLYPATIGLYRSAGYGLAGGHYSIRAQTSALPRLRSPAELRRATDADIDAMKALHTARARRHDGNLDRGAYIWARVFAPGYTDAERFVVTEDGVVTGYTCFAKKVAEVPYHTLEITDLVASTPAAHDRLLDLFVTHRSFVKSIGWNGPPIDPFLTRWPELHYTVSLHTQWMVRICHVAKALEERGYDENIRATLSMSITDSDVPENEGHYTLSVADGRCMTNREARPGSGLKLNIRGLASLYTGFLGARTLRELGQVEGDDEAIDIAERLFVPRSPWMTELF